MINYQKELDKLIQNLEKEKRVPKLLIHSCCAPCSSYVLEYLSQYFEITVLYYNPNIYPQAEYERRLNEIIDLLNLLYPENLDRYENIYFNKAKMFSIVKKVLFTIIFIITYINKKVEKKLNFSRLF